MYAEQAVALDSNFAEAWALVSTRHSWLAFQSIPTNTDAERLAAARAVALAPNAPHGYIARGLYDLNVASDLKSARVAFASALRLDPSSAAANSGLAEVEAGGGEWVSAVAHAQQATALDPRSADAADRLSPLVLSTRRYPEARVEAERALNIESANVSVTEDRVMSFLGVGDIAGAVPHCATFLPASIVPRSPLTWPGTSTSTGRWTVPTAPLCSRCRPPRSAVAEERGEWCALNFIGWLATR